MKNFPKIRIGTSIVAFLILLLCTSIASAEFQKTKIAVLDFELHGNSMSTEGIGGIVSEWFTTALVQDGRFDVIERAMLQKIINEQKLAMTGIVDENTASKLGKILGVKNVITGSVLNLKSRIEVNARIIGVENGSIVAAENVVSSSVEDLQSLVNDLTRRIVYHFPMTGYIVKKSSKHVMVDLGKDVGLHSGMEFIVFKEGEVIRHPKTGEVLDVEKIHTGRIRIIRVNNNMSEAEILKEESEGISYGQMVQSVRGSNPVKRPRLPGKQKNAKSKTGKQNYNGRLTVKTTPEHATIRILNIVPKYYPAMQLPAGKYHLEISSPSYNILYKWIDLPPEKETIFEFTLEPHSGYFPPPTETETANGSKLSSDNSSIAGTGSTAKTNKQREAKKKQAMKDIRKSSHQTADYHRKDFCPGERDNLATGRQAPPVLPLQTGSFMMGGNRYLEKPRHYVIIDKNVFMSVSEVTFADYMEFCADTGAAVPDDSSWGRGDHPVINVSWNKAVAYTKWLTKQTGVLYRLPYESEWEWAARAGEDVQYCWGSDFKQNQSNCKECGSIQGNGKTSVVRSFKPNKFGFFDMSGNVWEWVQDCWVDTYVHAPKGQNEREFKGNCSNRTVRGGAWNSPKRQVTTSARLGIWADTKSNYIGFRIVRDATATLEPERNEVGLMPSIQTKN